MVADRMAARREGTDPILVIDLAAHYQTPERDYEELKQELGLGHLEGRNWRGFHHHATLCMAYGFLVAERNRFSPSARVGQLGFVAAGPPPNFRPRGRRVHPGRHNPHSIATIRILLARWLLRQLPHCSFCGSSPG
jgi:hypothetical protein